MVVFLVQVELPFQSNGVRLRENEVVFGEIVVQCEVDFLTEVDLTHHDAHFGNFDWSRQPREHLQCQLVELIDLDLAMLESGPGPNQRGAIDDAAQLYWLFIYNSVTLHLIDELH